MFVDIVKFSDHCLSLTPQQILNNISQIFQSYEENISKYPLITKIKLIGDVFMCASGLFHPKEPPIHHTEQMIKFSLDILQSLEELNLKLNTSFNVRIGINTGGPIIAGVLGTEKPIFDIIGDPINVASRLQSTGIPGRIQISQKTYEIIQNLDY